MGAKGGSGASETVAATGFDWSDRGLIEKLEGLPREVVRATAESVQETTRRIEGIARAKTPVRSGKARRGWTSRVDRNRLEGQVRNREPHASALEAGHSKQAPNGMLGPAFEAGGPIYKRELERRVGGVLRG